ncbi:hypothetical protein CCAX7_38860 [Capsulimonas corticalis]|uniref:Uncharacterized protein n=1 Tax=Capsulimonas corticalis TaxID=2219043 RepID=A0A402D3R3_9BACT|nr:hypothetical protein [Capsulimonas corticalis]BDI31835.1 hypothetical protein CCAX7_38860 [Capsulimonas corticalis]
MPKLTMSNSGDTPEITPDAASNRTERRLVGAMIAAALFLTSFSALLGYALVPPGMQFVGSAYNIDDFNVYLSWLHQTTDGQFFQHNLFTTDPQPSLLFSFLFSLMGLIARVTHLPLAIVLHLTRIAGGWGLLWLAYRFITLCFPKDRVARLASLGFLCFSSGLGWMHWSQWSDKNPPGAPIDAFQPEAYTFLSLYLSPLFTVSTLLILGTLYGLLLSFRTGRMRYASIAGLCGFVLGNIHSYDVFHIAAAWGLFLVVWTIWKRGRAVARVWAHAVWALALTMPTTLYIYYIYRTNAVFNERAHSLTLSPPLWQYVLGYGLVFFLAVCALVLAWRYSRAKSRLADAIGMPAPRGEAGTFWGWSNGTTLMFVACWAVAGLCVIHLPFNFQRKMLMGEHIPLCILAGWAASTLTQQLAPRARYAVVSLLVLLTFPSNALFLVRDANHLQVNSSETSQWPFLNANYLAVADWLTRNTPQGAAIAMSPIEALYLPGMTGRTVWAGHWSETPHYGETIQAFTRFSGSETADSDRRDFLKSTRAQYLVYPKDVSKMAYTTHSGQTRTFTDFAASPPPYLIPVYSNDGYAVFQIDLAK